MKAAAIGAELAALHRQSTQRRNVLLIEVRMPAELRGDDVVFDWHPEDCLGQFGRSSTTFRQA